MPSQRDLDMDRKYRRCGAAIGNRRRRRRRAYERRGLVALVVFALAVVILGLISGRPVAPQPLHQLAGRVAKGHE